MSSFKLDQIHESNTVCKLPSSLLSLELADRGHNLSRLGNVYNDECLDFPSFASQSSYLTRQSGQAS